LICVKLIEVSAENDRLIFSERAVQVDADTRQTLWDTIAPGMVMEGVITNLTDFGAFVDLGGVEGLIHISELSWSRLKHPSDIVDIGETIDAKVLQVDHERKRVALSYKMTRHDPWQDIETRYRPDQIVEGVIRDVAPYGVFVTLEDELEGLVHVSEFGDLGGTNPLDSVERGQYIVVRVMNVNARNRRIALSLRGIVFSAE
jgi:small subunit ribosomal protein S1